MNVLDRIQALLNKAESTDNEHEADAYLGKAQRLATLHAVDLELARLAASGSGTREQPEERQVAIGAPRQLANRVSLLLYLAIARVNDVVANIARDSTYVVAYGMPSDLDVVETMFLSLRQQMVHAGNRHVAGRSWRDDFYRGDDYNVRPMNARRARIHFNEGFVTRIAERLREARTDAEQETTTMSVAGADGQTTSGAMVLKGRALVVREFYDATSRAGGRWNGGRSSGASSSTMRGREAGSRARLGPAPRGLAPGA